MRVALIHEAKLPVRGYGGTERVVWWLSKALAAQGVEVTLVCLPPSHCPWARVVHPDFRKQVDCQLSGVDLLHFFNTPAQTPQFPHIVTIEGNGKSGEVFTRNTAFVSRNHAMRHGAECFVYNGVDPDDYLYSDKKNGSLLFLGRASWRVKNVVGAMRLAKASGRELHILGGKRWVMNHWGGIHWHGMLGGRVKAQRIAAASGLLFPVLWNEPFGIAVIESLVSGTPVLASPFGSLPELVGPSVGRICASEQAFLEGIEALPSFRPKDCREWALERFSYRKMALAYLKLYEKVLSGQSLNSNVPATRDPMDALDSIPLEGVGNSEVQPA